MSVVTEFRFSGTATDNNTRLPSIIKSALTMALLGNGLKVTYLVITKGDGLNYAINLGVTTLYNLSLTEMDAGTRSSINSVFSTSDITLDGAYQIQTNGTGSTISINTTTYTVKAGDTLAAIARRFNTTVANLVALNNIANPNIIRVGQVLRINGSATNTTTTPVITGTTPNGSINVTTTNIPNTPPNNSNNPSNPSKSGFMQTLSDYFGVGTAVIGVAGVVILIILTKDR